MNRLMPCRACRGYSLEASWCNLCKGKGVENKPISKTSREAMEEDFIQKLYHDKVTFDVT